MSINDLLANGITIEGKVRASSWEDEKEKVLLQTEDFQASHFKLDKEILYMFVGTDGYLHIELEN